jgi:transcriptional regulator with XRE-family HTH domain
MITPFGIATRKLRLDKGLRLLDMAEQLGVSSSFISAVETGKKPIPAGYVTSVIRALGLTGPEARELQKAADRSKSFVDVDGLQGTQRELVAAFARKLDDLPPEFLELIKKKVFKSTGGEIPFKRKRKGLLVSAASTRALWDFAERVRAVFVSEDEICFPIMDVLEFRLQNFEEGFYLDVCSHEEMGTEEGLVLAGSNCIREDSHPVYRDAEWQADTFAGGLLMSSKHLPRLSCHESAAMQCGMTPMAANVMWSKYQKEGLLSA